MAFQKGPSKPEAGGKKRSFSKTQGGKGAKPDGQKPNFKKREFKAQGKRKEATGPTNYPNSSSGMEIVRAEEPQKYKKINYGAKTGDGMNRRQK